MEKQEGEDPKLQEEKGTEKEKSFIKQEFEDTVAFILSMLGFD